MKFFPRSCLSNRTACVGLGDPNAEIEIEGSNRNHSCGERGEGGRGGFDVQSSHDRNVLTGLGSVYLICACFLTKSSGFKALDVRVYSRPGIASRPRLRRDSR